jgi:hypothetical protein
MIAEQVWWGQFARFFADVAHANARTQLWVDIKEAIAQHGSKWLLDYVLDEDDAHRVIPPVVHKVMAEYDWSERLGHGQHQRWILTMKGRQALAERKAERELDQFARELNAIGRPQRAQPLPVVEQIRRYDAEWSD